MGSNTASHLCPSTAAWGGVGSEICIDPIDCSLNFTRSHFPAPPLAGKSECLTATCNLPRARSFDRGQERSSSIRKLYIQRPCPEHDSLCESASRPGSAVNSGSTRRSKYKVDGTKSSTCLATTPAGRLPLNGLSGPVEELTAVVGLQIADDVQKLTCGALGWENLVFWNVGAKGFG